MCGIFGIFGEKPGLDKIKLVGGLLHHRGPDEFGYEVGDNFGLTINRLSIVDIKNGSQPFCNSDKTVIAVGNGEIYNYKKLKQELISEGCFFRSDSDIEILPYIYSKWGLEGFKRLRGMFGIAIWDKQKNKGYIFRDFSGIKPLYYCLDTLNQTLVFASEIKALLKFGVHTEPNFAELLNALSYRSSSAANTCFTGINKLQPGELLEFSVNPFNVSSSVVMPERIRNNHLDLHDLIYQSIGGCLMGDVAVGAFLSGGIDSGLNVMMMSKILGKSFDTFTVGYGVSGDEFKEAKIISQLAGSRHHEVLVDFNKINKEFNKMIWHMDEPFFDPAFFPSYFLAKEASLFTKVVMVGDGSDEVFAGYQKHIDLFNSFNSKKIDIRRFLESRMPFNFFELNKTMNHFPYNIVEMESRFLSCSTFDDYLREALRIDRELMLPSLQLMKVDKSTMAHGLEARVPFLDYDLVDYSSYLPAKYLVGPLQGKLVLRDIAKRYLPEKVCVEKKKIFFVPIDIWMTWGLEAVANRSIASSELLKELTGNQNLKEASSSFSPYQKLCLLMIDNWYEIFFENMDIDCPLVFNRS